MTYLEARVTYADGSERSVVEAFRDDPAGRQAADKFAFAAMARPQVASVEVTRHDRVIQTGGRGRYR